MTLPKPQADWALFLDFDGTLVEIAERPEGIELGADLSGLLAALDDTLGGALAVVTGRALEQFDAFLNGAVKVVAGHHGHELRRPDGTVQQQDFPREALAEIRRELGVFVAAHPGLLLEVKGRSLALHFRQMPELENACDRISRRLAGKFGDQLFVLDGKMVREIRAAGQDKGDAVASLMSLPPFNGRFPVYAGDDTTDEDAFAVVNKMGGVTIKVGDGETCARHRVPSVDALKRWLGEFRHLSDREVGR
jgi:trehalose 6-phosphate phosphatase